MRKSAWCRQGAARVTLTGSARIPRILRLPALGIAVLSHHGQEAFVAGVEPGLELGPVAPANALHVFLIVSHHVIAMFLDITNGGLDLLRAEAKNGGDHVAVPSRFVIFDNVVDGDSCPRDLGPASGLDDRSPRAWFRPSPFESDEFDFTLRPFLREAQAASGAGHLRPGKSGVEGDTRPCIERCARAEVRIELDRVTHQRLVRVGELLLKR